MQASRRTIPFALAAIAGALLAAAGAAAQDSDIALRASRLVADPDGHYADSRRIWQGIPGITRTLGHRLWATWYTGGSGEGARNYVMLASSDDDGTTWSAPRLALDPPDPVRAFDPCLWTDPNGRLWLFWAQSAGLWDGRGGVWAITSDDPDAEQPTWSPPRRIADGVMMNKPTVLEDGQWLLPISGWRFKAPRIEESLAAIGHPEPAEAAKALARSPGDRGGSMVWVSRDEGRTFEYRGQALVPEPQHDEHMIVERENGELWMLVRTAYGIGESVSSDQGATWSEGGPSGIAHPVTRFHLRRLELSGRLLLIRHIPDPEYPKLRTRLTAFLSDDDGKTWEGGLLLDGRDHVSYPDATQADDGEIYVIYDRERGGAKEILMARIREEDIFAGRVVAQGSRLQMIVNKATGQR